MHGIGRFISVSDLFRPIENARNARLENLSLEKPHRTPVVLAQTDINIGLASALLCNDLRCLNGLWLRAGKKFCKLEAYESGCERGGGFSTTITQDPPI